MSIRLFRNRGRMLTGGFWAALLVGLLGCSGLRASRAPLTPPPVVSSTPLQGPAGPALTPTTGAKANTKPVPATAPAAGIVFTGNATDSGYDGDRNGLFEFLQVNIGVDVIEAGWFGVTAALTTPDGRLVAVGGLTPDLFRAAPVDSTELEVGVQAIAIYFEGRAIRSFGADGPYAVTVGLFGASGLITRIDLTTGWYNHADFQGHLIEVQRIHDGGVDTDAIPGYNLLRVAVDTNLLADGSVTVQGQLFAGSTFVADVAQTHDLKAGAQTVNLDFSGLFIAGSGMDGPYTVYLSFSDAYYGSNETFETRAYRYQEFQLPGALFTGSTMDGGVDTDGNGLFEQLYIKVELVATIPGRYALGGVLQDGAGRVIQVVEKEAALETTPVEVVLLFEGAAIRRVGADGPYQVLLTITDAKGNDLMHQEFTTSTYGCGAFESE